jgi:hypothetical protein
MQNISQKDLKDFYSLVANNNEDAYNFIVLWQTYCHSFDDLVDDKCTVEELINNNLGLAKVMKNKFFSLHAELLYPQIYLSAEAYRASEKEEKNTSLGEFLSHEGNNMIRTVALITGGFQHLIKISQEIRRLMYIEHPLKEAA